MWCSLCRKYFAFRFGLCGCVYWFLFDCLFACLICGQVNKVMRTNHKYSMCFSLSCGSLKFKMNCIQTYIMFVFDRFIIFLLNWLDFLSLFLSLLSRYLPISLFIIKRFHLDFFLSIFLSLSSYIYVGSALMCTLWHRKLHIHANQCSGLQMQLNCSKTTKSNWMTVAHHQKWKLHLLEFADATWCPETIEIENYDWNWPIITTTTKKMCIANTVQCGCGNEHQFHQFAKMRRNATTCVCICILHILSRNFQPINPQPSNRTTKNENQNEMK